MRAVNILLGLDKISSLADEINDMATSGTLGNVREALLDIKAVSIQLRQILAEMETQIPQED